MKAAQELQRVLYLACRFVAKSLLATFASILLIFASPSFGASVTIHPGDVIDVTFRFDRPFISIPNDLLVTFGPRGNSYTGTFRSILYDGSVVLGSGSFTGGGSGFTLSSVFLSPDYPSANLGFPVVDFTTIRNQTIQGRVTTTLLSGQPSFSVDAQQFPTYATVSALTIPGGAIGPATVLSVTLNGAVIYSPVLPTLPQPAALSPSPIHVSFFPLNPNPAKPTVIITHGWEPCLDCTPVEPPWEKSMKDGLGNLGANVVIVRWDDAFTRSLQSATSEVANVGRELATALLKNGVQHTAGVQFIGHSLGTLVNAYAANIFSQQGIPVNQFTILDRPFGQGIPTSGGVFLGLDADGPIFRTLLPKEKVIWVDNYYGTKESLTLAPAVGAPFSPNALAFDHAYVGADHTDVPYRYLATLPTPQSPITNCPVDGGFLCSVGIGQPSLPQSFNWDPLPSLLVPGNPLAINPVNWLVYNCALAINVATCQEHSPAYFWQPNFTVGTDDMYLSFDFKWTNIGDGDWLTLHFGDNLLFSFVGSVFQGSDYINSGLIPIKQFAGQSKQLLFSLNNVGQPDAAISIRNIQVTTFVALRIDIKPGDTVKSINSTSQGGIPVAILSSATFNAPARIARESLTFGLTGGESSLWFCNPDAQDINGDGFLDLVCHFYTPKTGFRPGDTRAVLKGRTLEGSPVIGTGAVRIVH